MILHELCGAPSYEVASGSIFTIKAEDVSGLTAFIEKPKVYYVVQLNGKARSKPIKVLTNSYPADTIECKMGIPGAVATCQLYVQPVFMGKKLAPVLISSEFRIVPASLELVNPTSACSGLLVALSGKFFGQQKPKIIIQQVDNISMKVTKKPCPIYTPLAYPDEKGAPGKSCMDLKTGDSLVKAIIPAGLKVGTYTLIMQNRISPPIQQDIQILSPRITAINPQTGSSGTEITVSGEYFGQKIPKLWLEYTNPKTGNLVKKICNIKKPLEFSDSKGHGGMSCMNIETGESRIKFYVPDKLPDVQSVLWLDNRTGKDSCPFAPSYRISGKIIRESVADVNVVLYENGSKLQETKSASDGSFKFDDLHNGNFVVKPEKSGYFFFPEEKEIKINGANSDGNDFISTVLGTYLVIDVSGGALAENYPFEIFEADKVPADIFSNPIYKTEKIVFRKFDSKASYTFTMGSPEKEVGRMSNEPQHEVTISQNLYVAVYEITQAQYRNVIGLNPSYYQGDTRPVEQVTWEDVRGGDWPGDPAGSGLPAQGTFLDLLSSKSKLECDLPTEAQWEMICRSTTSTALNSGQNLSNTNQCPEADEVGWYVGNVSNGQHREVGQKLPNYKGLFDMHGNVWELCLDWYVKDIGTAAVTDPLGPSSGSLRALRGGGWINYAGSIRSARRSYIGPRDYFNYAGFRPVIRAYNISGTVTGTVSKSVNFSLSGISNMKTTSDTNGAYAFYGLVKGNYTVTPSLQGYLFEPESIAVEIIKEDVKDVNFVSTGSKFSISGKITGEVLAGVTVKAEGTMVGSAVSSEDGTYKISGLISGNYTVTPTLQGYIFEPSSQNVSIYGTDVKDVNFNAKIK